MFLTLCEISWINGKNNLLGTVEFFQKEIFFQSLKKTHHYRPSVWNILVFMKFLSYKYFPPVFKQCNSSTKEFAY